MFPGMNMLSMMPGMGMGMPNQSDAFQQIQNAIQKYVCDLLENPTEDMKRSIKKATTKILKEEGYYLEPKDVHEKHERWEKEHKEKRDEKEEEKHPVLCLMEFVDEHQGLLINGTSPVEVEVKVKERLKDLTDEETKVLGRLISADGIKKHALALGMTEEKFREHIHSISEKL